jgi:hypothetical protein
MPLLHWLTRDADLRAADRVPYRLLDEPLGLDRVPEARKPQDERIVLSRLLKKSGWKNGVPAVTV